MNEKDFEVLYSYFLTTYKDIADISQVKKITEGLYRAYYKRSAPIFSSERLEILFKDKKCILTSIKENYVEIKNETDHNFKIFIDVTKTIDYFTFKDNEVTWTQYIGTPILPIVTNSKSNIANWESNRLTSPDFLTYIGYQNLTEPKQKIEFNLEEVFTKTAGTATQDPFTDISNLAFNSKQKSIFYDKP